MHISLENKKILISGGTGALGGLLAEKLLDEKASVFFTYHQNRSKAEELIKRGARGFQIDFTDRESIKALKENLKQHTDHLDGLVCNAATLFDKTISKLPANEWDRVIEVNLTSIFFLTKTLLPLLYKDNKAKVVNVTSRVGVIGGFGQSNYAAAKAGLIGFTKSLAKEVGRKGICVNAINPGFMITGMNQNLSEDILNSRLKESLLGVYSDPEKVADFILYLLSNHSDGITGQVFHIDSRIV